LNGKPQYMKIYSTFGLSRPLKGSAMAQSG